MDILEIVTQKLNQISQTVGVAVEVKSQIPFADDEAYFRRICRDKNKTDAYWISWQEQIAAKIAPDGSKVSAIVREDVKSSEIEQLMLGLASVITGVCLNLQGKVAVHANAISIDGTACAFAGYSGMGKSTLTAYCISRGAGFLTDDVLVVDKKGLVIPGSPHLKLYPQTGKILGLDAIATDDYKNFYDVRKLGAEFDNVPTPLKVIYLLAKSDRENVYAEEIAPSKAVFELLTHSYFASELISNNPHILETYINSIDNVVVKKLFYPRDFQVLPRVYDFLIAEVA